MVRLPVEYQEVEYLESTGTQYIDLDFGFDQTDEVETRFSISKDHYIDKYIVSPIQWNTDNNRFGMGVHRGTSSLGAGYYTIAYGDRTTSGTKFSPDTLNDGNFHDWKYENYTFYIADVGRTKSVLSIPFGSTTENLRLFYGYRDNTKGQIAYYKHIKQDGTGCNFIPCYRKSDNEAGMYDTVSGTFYTNNGTGTFLVGNPVEYGTISLLEARRRILLNTPHFESLSGATASFETDMSAKLKECKVYFSPVQEGSGDPSPDNVRPIHGCDGVTVYHNNNSLTIPFPQTIYGGYVDLVKGEVVEELSIIDLGTVSLSQYSKSNHCWSGAIAYMKFGNAIELSELYCDSYKPLSKKSILSDGEDLSIWPYNTGQRRLIIRNDSYIQEDGTYAITSFKESLQGVMACIPLATPNTYSLDPVTIRTLKGLNNIWSSANGNIEISYWTH